MDKGMCKGMDKGMDKGMGKGKGKSAGHPNEVTPLGDFIGVIKSFNPNNGYGFIDCPELKALYFHDVFLHHQQLGEFGVGETGGVPGLRFGVGETVQFTAYLNNAGKPQGKDLRFPDGGPGPAKRARSGTPVGGDWGFAGQAGGGEAMGPGAEWGGWGGMV